VAPGAAHQKAERRVSTNKKIRRQEYPVSSKERSSKSRTYHYVSPFWDEMERVAGDGGGGNLEGERVRENVDINHRELLGRKI